jgi:hypothetical protein
MHMLGAVVEYNLIPNRLITLMAHSTRVKAVFK